MLKKILSAKYYKNNKDIMLLECGHTVYGKFIGQDKHDCWKCDEIKKGTMQDKSYLREVKV